jgi:hypothetical protein
VVAIGDAKVVGSDDHSGWPGGHFIWYRLLDGDHAGLYIYVAEDLQNMVPSGTAVKAGARIATAYPGPSCIEIGFATASGETAAATIAPHAVSPGHTCPAGASYNTGAQDGCDTVGWQAFARWLEQLGAKVVAERPPAGGTRPPCVEHACSRGGR